jgi:excinuclease ABC subunit A
VPWLERRLRETRSSWIREEIEGLVAETHCTTCDGTRLRREARFVRIGGRSIVEVSAMPIRDAGRLLRRLSLGPVEREIAAPIRRRSARGSASWSTSGSTT